MHKTVAMLFLAIPILALAVAASAQGPTDTAAWYRFDDGVGTTTVDSSVNANDGILEGGAAWSADVDTSRFYDTGLSCVSFNHVATPDNRVRVPHDAALNAGTGNITICFFLKVDGDENTARQAVFVEKGSSAVGDSPTAQGKRYQVVEKDNMIRVVIDDNATKMQYAAWAGDVYTGSWVHVAAVVDRVAQQARLYADGVELPGFGSGSWPTGSIDEDTDLYIGNIFPESEGGNYYPESFTGLMDDVRIYKRALTQSEIQEIAAFMPTPTPTPTGGIPWPREIPDIVIGDVGDISGSGESARHLFRYLNALNLFDDDVIDWVGWPLDDRNVFLYRNAATDPIDIRASRPTDLVNTLTDAEYAALWSFGPAPGPGTNIVESAAAFGFLSLMNMDLVSTPPTNAYAATPEENGVTLTPNPSSGLGATDLALIVTGFDPPTTPTVIAERWFTVYTLMDQDDRTSGAVVPILEYDFAGGSPQGWVGQSDPGVGIGFPAVDLTSDSVIGAIGFDALAFLPGLGWGVWKSSNDGVNPQYVVSGEGREGQVLRARANLVTESGAVRTGCLSYRFNVQNLFGNHWSGVLAPSTGTRGDIAQIDCPADGDPLEVQIHWAVPYDLNEYADDGALNVTDWQTLIPHPSVPADGRDYVIQWDGLDMADTFDLFMDSCIVEAYPRPADKATPDLEWGGGGSEIPFNDPVNGFLVNTDNPFPHSVDLGTGEVQAGYVSLTMGDMPTTPSVAQAKWQQAAQNPIVVTQTLPEVANDLVRYTVTYDSGTSSDAAPDVRFQTVPIRNAPTSAADVDATIWYDNFVPWDFLSGCEANGVALNPAAEDAPGTPRVAAAAGSTIDLYRYTMNTIAGTRFLNFYWDAYGCPMPGSWPDQTGALRVTHIAVNAGLPNP